MKMLFVLLCMSYANVAQMNMCVRCTPGKYQTGTSNLPCSYCTMNTYSPSYGMTACTSCETNSISAPGSSSCECAQNYARTNNFSGCTFACAYGRVQVGSTCQCPRGSNGTDSGACALCPVHTYASQVGAHVCTACPTDMRSAIGSVSEDACICAVGFVKEGSACTELLKVSVVTQVEMVLQQPSNVTLEEVGRAISRAVSVAYNISEEFLVIDVRLLPVASIRRLLQMPVWTMKYSITIRVLFPAGASQSTVNQTQSMVGSVNTLLQAGLQTESSGVQFIVLNSTVPVVRTVEGVFNANSREVVSCTLVSWQDDRGEAQACERMCGVDEFLVAVAYVQGLFVLDCQRRTSTPAPAPPGLPPPPPAESSANMGAIVGGVAGGVVAVLGSIFVFRICYTQQANKVQPV